MAEEEQDLTGQYFAELGARIRDLEEKNKLLKDRLLLIGQNLIDVKQENQEKNLETKKELEKIKENMKKMLSFLESASAEFPKFARKEDLEILTKQAKMFQPLEFVTRDELKKAIK